MTNLLLLRAQGWARRPERDGGMYGKSYLTPVYRAMIQLMFEKGANNSSDKMGSAEMREKIEESRPGFYRYPGESDISKTISALYEAQKKGKPNIMRQKKVPAEIEARIRELMLAHPDLTGMSIEKLVHQSFNGHLPIGYVRKDVMGKVGAWRAAKKKKAREAIKKLLIG
jgi:hypothetical protein